MPLPAARRPRAGFRPPLRPLSRPGCHRQRCRL